MVRISSGAGAHGEDIIGSRCPRGGHHREQVPIVRTS